MKTDVPLHYWWGKFKNCRKPFQKSKFLPLSWWCLDISEKFSIGRKPPFKQSILEMFCDFRCLFHLLNVDFNLLKYIEFSSSECNSFQICQLAVCYFCYYDYRNRILVSRIPKCRPNVRHRYRFWSLCQTWSDIEPTFLNSSVG